MAAEIASPHDVFPHIRIVMGMVIGLGVTRMLSGLARVVQHPGQYRLYPVHLAWVGSVLLMLVHFWWWEFGLYAIETWTFGKYLFIIFYAITLFLLCALLFPDSMLDYTSYEDFFYSRRAWFFGLLAATYLLDVVDTLLKGPEHFARFGNEYLSARRSSSLCASPRSRCAIVASTPHLSRRHSSTRYRLSCGSSTRSYDRSGWSRVGKRQGSTMYKAVGSRGSRVSRVLWMLEELGQPYEFVEVKLRSPEAYALNPSGKVPILIDGELTVTDSAAICVYLGDKHADKGMGANPGLAGRAEMDSWMHFAQSELEAPLWNKLRHRFLLPKEMRVDVGPAAAYDFATEVKALDRRLGDRPFALGDRFSAIDVLLGDMGGWARAGRFPIESNRVNAYFDRMLTRPARARAQATASARKSESIFGKHDA